MKDDVPGAETFMPPRRSLRAMRLAIDGRRGCPLYKDATHALFGEGPAHARLVDVAAVGARLTALPAAVAA